MYERVSGVKTKFSNSETNHETSQRDQEVKLTEFVQHQSVPLQVDLQRCDESAGPRPLPGVDVLWPEAGEGQLVADETQLPDES